MRDILIHGIQLRIRAGRDGQRHLPAAPEGVATDHGHALRHIQIRQAVHIAKCQHADRTDRLRQDNARDLEIVVEAGHFDLLQLAALGEGDAGARIQV